MFRKSPLLSVGCWVGSLRISPICWLLFKAWHLWKASKVWTVHMRMWQWCLPSLSVCLIRNNRGDMSEATFENCAVFVSLKCLFIKEINFVSSGIKALGYVELCRSCGGLFFLSFKKKKKHWKELLNYSVYIPECGRERKTSWMKYTKFTSLLQLAQRSICNCL